MNKILIVIISALIISGCDQKQDINNLIQQNFETAQVQYAT